MERWRDCGPNAWDCYDAPGPERGQAAGVIDDSRRPGGCE
jgi:hypothetical protein